MGVKHGLGKAARLEQAETQKHRVAHTSPDCIADVIHKGDVLYQHGIDRHADNYQKCLEAQCQQRADVVLSHAAPFLAQHGCHGNRGDGGHK